MDPRTGLEVAKSLCRPRYLEFPPNYTGSNYIDSFIAIPSTASLPHGRPESNLASSRESCCEKGSDKRNAVQ